MSPVATGSVYVINTTNQAVTLILNYNALPDLSPAHGREQHYVPSSLRVARSNANRIKDPVFAEENQFQVLFSGVLNSYRLMIELESYPSNHSLLLHIFYGYLVLTDDVTNALVCSTLPLERQPKIE